MMLAQVADAHNSDAQTFHDQAPPSFAAPSVLALLLVLEEIEQAADLRAEMAVGLENLGGVTGGHPGAEDQAVGLVE